MTKLIYNIGDLLDDYKREEPEHSDKFMMVSVILGLIDDEMHEDCPSLDSLKHKIEAFSNGEVPNPYIGSDLDTFLKEEFGDDT